MVLFNYITIVASNLKCTTMCDDLSLNKLLNLTLNLNLNLNHNKCNQAQFNLVYKAGESVHHINYVVGSNLSS